MSKKWEAVHCPLCGGFDRLAFELRQLVVVGCGDNVFAALAAQLGAVDDDILAARHLPLAGAVALVECLARLLLLLDEHTAALDPKTASKVLNLTEEIVDENHLTTLMVTHNMNDAIRLGNRLIMMHEGHVIYDVAGDEKKSLTVADLLQKFEEVSGGELANDRMLLS